MGLSEDEELELLELEEQEYQANKRKTQSAPEGSEMGLGERIGRGALEALPTAGMLAGGFFGGSAGLATPIPGGAAMGAVGGAGLGAAAGKSLEQAGKALFFDEYPESTSEMYKDIGKEALTGAVGEMGGAALGPALKLAGQGLGKVGTKVGSALTGISEQEIKTYAKNADKIKEMAKASDGSTLEAADQIRKQYNSDIGKTISGVNDEIGRVLSTSQKSVEAQPIIESLEKYKSRLDPHLWKEQVNQIDDLIGRVQVVSKDGTIPVAKANEIKQFLQDKASSAYRNGDMFQIGKEAANAAKSGAAQARSLVDQAEPQVTKLNAQLAKFHGIEDSMNSNILKQGAPEAALMAAGSGGNARNMKALQDLGELTGSDMLSEAQNLAAMRTFNNPAVLPVDTTGKSLTRMGLGSALGTLGGGVPGAVIGGALTSPMVLKSAIDVGRGVGAASGAVPSPMKDAVYKSVIQKYFSAPDNQVKEEKNPDSAMIMEKVKGTPYEKVLQSSMSKGGVKSFAAANYVLMNRDQKYRDLVNQQDINT